MDVNFVRTTFSDAGAAFKKKTPGSAPNNAFRNRLGSKIALRRRADSKISLRHGLDAVKVPFVFSAEAGHQPDVVVLREDDALGRAMLEAPECFFAPKPNSTWLAPHVAVRVRF